MNDPSQISRDFRLAKGSFWKKLIQAEVATEAKRSMLKLQNGLRNIDLPYYNSNKNKGETVVS